MPTSDARLAKVEAVLLEVREDVAEIKMEALRTRDRLHKLEGVSTLFVQTQKESRRSEEAQYQRLGLRIQVLTLVIATAAIVVPVIVILLSGK